MTDTRNEFHYLALQHAIQLVRELNFESKSPEEAIAAKANITFKLYLAISSSNKVTAEEIKILKESN